VVSRDAGLLLLTGGRGRRFGGPKHLQPHPAGGSWGGHLAAVFETVFPGGPVHLLGQGLPDRPDLAALADPGQGPAVALRHWAAQAQAEPPARWWLVACDQLGWTPETLRAWHQAALAADPAAGHWVLARAGGRLQPLGGFLASRLLPLLPGLAASSLMGLADALPVRVLEASGDPWGDVWLDVDTPQALARFLAGRPGAE